MPIKSLESYLFERKLVNTSSIDILHNATIGIDVEHYLSRIYTYKKEQFLAGVGGVPSSLNDYIQSDLQVFQEFNIKPIFVIPGLKIQLQTETHKTNELTPSEQHLESTWNKLNSKNANPYGYNNLSNESFRLFTNPLPITSMINDLIKLFISKNIDYLICPYDASFQLSYLYQNKIIDSIYGSTDLLLTHVDKFILGMEFQSKDFRFVDRFKVLNELSLTERQFLDLSIMVGCSIQPTTFPNFPPLPKPNSTQPFPQLSYIKLGLDIIFQNNSFSGMQADLHGYIASLNDPKLVELYLKGLSAIKFMPVLNLEGNAELYGVEMAKLGLVNPTDLLDGKKLENGVIVAIESPPAQQQDKKNGSQTQEFSAAGNKAPGTDKNDLIKIPNDLHDIISQRLPAELYLYQSIGLAPLSLLGAITQGSLNVRPPSETGLTDSYKKLITSPFYSQLFDGQFNLITQLITRYYQVKRIKVHYWFKDEVVELNNRLPQPLFKTFNHLHHYSGEGDANGDFELLSFLADLKDDHSPSATPFDKEIKTRKDIVSTALLRTLFSFEVIDKKTNKLTGLGQSLKTFVQDHRDELNDKLIQELILLLLLIRSNTLKLDQPIKEFSSVPKFFKDTANADVNLTSDDTKKIALISRVLSLHKFDVHPINYQGPISRSLLSFRSHLKFIQTNLINDLECVLLDFIVRQDNNNIKSTYKQREDWYQLINQLPFYEDIDNTLLGVAAEIYLEYVTKQSKSKSSSATGTNENATSKQALIQSGHDHVLNTVFQINNFSFNINVHGINSIKSTQYHHDLSEGFKLWSLFIKLVKTVNGIDNKLVSDSYLKDFVDADEWLQQYV